MSIWHDMNQTRKLVFKVFIPAVYCLIFLVLVYTIFFVPITLSQRGTYKQVDADVYEIKLRIRHAGVPGFKEAPKKIKLMDTEVPGTVEIVSIQDSLPYMNTKLLLVSTQADKQRPKQGEATLLVMTSLWRLFSH